MIISHGRRYIFVHIPKTGGTSLALALEARALKDDILIGDTPKAQKRHKRQKALSARGRLWKHSRLSDIDGLVPREALADMLIFTLVRNPWDRMVSYYHWLREQTFDHPAVALARETDFAAFLGHPQTARTLRTERYGAYVTDAAGVERAAAFVRLEHLRADLAPVEAHLGFTLSDIPHVNRSDRAGQYQRYYDNRLRDLVAEAYSEDIARFGYRF
ncbi:Type II secretory pathway, pullulanase PulA [Rhodobacteraceae bacterium CCMM004]|nr:Type II secretory pathway, pullulanase PulA [Rhodobacteraceae bacterium CCMM004]